MDADEREICNYLRSWGGQFVSGKEVCRRAGGKRKFRENPNWAVPVLARLVEKTLIETDSNNHFRILPAKKKDKNKKWVSPQMKKILEKSGKDFSGIIQIDTEEE